jgi:hypothetical protein
MTWLQIIFPLALAGQLALCAPPAESDTGQPKSTPPVLRSSEPSDSVVVMLPGAPAPPEPVAVPAPVPAEPPAPAPVKLEPAPVKPAPIKPAQIKPAQIKPAPIKPAPIKPVPIKPVETAVRPEPAKSPAEQETHALSKTPKTAVLAEPTPDFSPEFAKDSALFCQKQIGHWKAADARRQLGKPLRQRPAFSDGKKSVNGRIYAFSDPSGRYKEMELDFDKSTGNLRTVFGYPPKMNWTECLQLWGNKVAAADARQGRTFYSYLDRRLDVLVDQKGNVISLGLY